MENFILHPKKRKNNLHNFPHDKYSKMYKSSVNLTTNKNRVGLMKDNKDYYVYKKSCKEYNEYKVIYGIQNIINISPHFCLSYGKIDTTILLEYAGKLVLKDYLQSPKVSENIVYSCVLQIVMALYFAYERYGFTHYDMHTDNVHLIKCDVDVVFVYKINGEYYYIPTYGYIPVILDYEFGYIDKLQNRSMNVNVRNIDAGFYKIVKSKYNDLKVFMSNVSYDLVTNEIDDTSSDSELEWDDDDDDLDMITIELLDKEVDIVYKECNYKNFRDYIIDQLSPLNIDNTTGHLHYKKCNDFPLIIYDLLKSVIIKYKDIDYNNLFVDNFSDIIQETVSLSNIEESKIINTNVALLSLKIIMKEFGKIQKCTTDKELSFTMFRILINVIRKIQNKIVKHKTKKYTEYVSYEFLYRIDKISKFVNPDNVKYEKLTIAIITFSKYLSYKLYSFVNKLKKLEDKICKDIDILDFNKCFNLINTKFSRSYIFNNNTSVHIWDYDDMNNRNTLLKDHLKCKRHYNIINTLEDVEIGKYLYDLI
jgi:hypothetical protein